jgi:3-hydroxybutyrate dehydrogenase
MVSDVVPTGVANEHNVAGDMDNSWRGVDSLVEELVRSGRAASSTLGDVSVEADAGRMVEEVLGRYGRLDILVNNAGIQHVAPVEEFPIETWDALIAINLSSAFHTIAAALPLMKKARYGRIVNIASAHGLVASPFKSAYVSAKHGIMGLTKTVALEVATDGITCNAICPGYVLTPLVEAQIPDQMKAHNMDRETVIREVMLDKQPTKEFVTVEQIGATAAFLCSDAAAQINGTHISVDGGWTAE